MKVRVNAMTDFKDIFVRLRKEKGLNQEEIAKALGLSKSSIAMWETGNRRPSPDVYEQIADFFNVDMDFLYGRTDIRRKIWLDETGRPYVPEETYYLNDETRMVAQEIFENDRVLFDVYRSSSKDRLVAYAKRLKELHDMEKMED